MAPLGQAIKIKPKESQSNTKLYGGIVDLNWTIGRSGFSSKISPKKIQLIHCQPVTVLLAEVHFFFLYVFE
jgi:hypothetical protein